jgi:hypothetical protein
MSGFIHDPLQTINLIADNVRDRYRDETAVLKEIAQNADDAQASRADFIIVTEGLPTARTRLLRGPALVAVNNGRFRRRDARGIRQFGLSVKSAEQGAIGKFGLGQKAVFYLCEAFLYRAEGTTEPEDPIHPYRGVINPWSDVESHRALFPDWDEFGEVDSALVDELMKPLGTFERRFVLWLPLRSESQLSHQAGRVDPIVGHYPDPNELLERVQSSTILAECLPMLAHLKTINVHEADGTKGWRSLASFNVSRGANRVLRGDDLPNQRVDLAGRQWKSAHSARSRRRSLHIALTTRSVRSSSNGPAGAKSTQTRLRRSSNASASSPGRTTSRHNSPCCIALRRTVAFPSDVFGPVEARAFALFALRWRSLVITPSTSR